MCVGLGRIPEELGTEVVWEGCKRVGCSLRDQIPALASLGPAPHRLSTGLGRATPRPSIPQAQPKGDRAGWGRVLENASGLQTKWVFLAAHSTQNYGIQVQSPQQGQETGVCAGPQLLYLSIKQRKPPCGIELWARRHWSLFRRRGSPVVASVTWG